MNALIDSDVIVAVLDGEEDQSLDSRTVMSAALKGAFEMFITPLIAANVMYALRRKWRTTRPSWQEEIDRAMTSLLTTTTMVQVDERDFLASFASDFLDREDGIQYFAAIRNRHVDLILTCNVKDYSEGTLPVMEPARFIAEYLKK
jgi:uncharacterized protein with PIN domain